MEVKGTAVIAIRDYVKSQHPAQYQQWIDSLTPTSKELFSGLIDSTKWYHVDEGVVDPTKNVGLLFYQGDILKGAWHSGRYSAQKALTGIYKIFVKATSPAYIIQRASRVFATYYRPCEIIVTESNPQSVRLDLTDIDKKYDVIENRIAGWIEQALEISGAKNVQLKIDNKPGVVNTREIFISWN